MAEFDDFTKSQIVTIQLKVIMDYVTKIWDGGIVYPCDVRKIQKIFYIVNEKNEQVDDTIPQGQ